MNKPCKESWRAHKDKDGYPLFARKYKGHWRVCRYVYSSTHNNYNFKPGEVVMHTCDHPWCVEPSHLKLGTTEDNNKDRANKDRSFHPTGSLHPMSVLTENDVLRIRRLYEQEKYLQRELAEEYGVTRENIRNIVNRKTWRHVK